jgi:hypothetical protein
MRQLPALLSHSQKSRDAFLPALRRVAFHLDNIHACGPRLQSRLDEVTFRLEPET